MNNDDFVLSELFSEAGSSECSTISQQMEIIAQPYCANKLRYRSDYETNKNRRGVLQSRNNPNYQSPTIRIPQIYLNIDDEYYIRICLVTVEHRNTKCRYIHPYELEDIETAEHNDKLNNAVWYPIQEQDIGGIKSFINLRIVRKKADDIKNYGNFRVFDSPKNVIAQQSLSVKDTIKEFQLYKLQLAFTIGKRILINDTFTSIVYAHTTIYSDEIMENLSKQSISDSDMSIFEMSAIERSADFKFPKCQIYRYAPRSGFADANEQILVYYKSKLKPRKYGELRIKFKWNTSNISWSADALDIEITDQLVSFRAPTFPYLFPDPVTVDVILTQTNRILDPINFQYISSLQCPTCQADKISKSNISSNQTAKKPRLSNTFSSNCDASNVSASLLSENPVSNAEISNIVLDTTT